MGDDEKKARLKLEEAEKKAKKTSGIFGFISGNSNNVSDACDLYVQAGNLFKVAKNWSASGQAFLKAGELHLNQGDAKHDAALRFSDAGNSFRKIDVQKAIDCFAKMTEIYTDMGKFSLAAKGHVVIAELYEEKGDENEKCIYHYQKAADFYKGEESKNPATRCLLKVAQISANIEQYRKAVEVFEEVAIYENDHPILKYNAKNHFFQALLCYFCIDQLDTQMALKRYEEISPSFSDSRECKFIKEILMCLEEKDADAFTEAVRNYDKISRLEPWYTSILVKIKRTIGYDDDEEDVR